MNGHMWACEIVQWTNRVAKIHAPNYHGDITCVCEYMLMYLLRVYLYKMMFVELKGFIGYSMDR